MYVGIDIGVTGAIAMLDTNGSYYLVEDLPMRKVVFTGQTCTILDGHLMHDIMDLRVHSESIIMIEDAVGNPTNGRRGMKTFYRVAGGVIAIAAMFTEPKFVSPQKWKRHFGLIGKDKKASLRLARERFPEAPLHLEGHHNRAEALLIAAYAWETVGGQRQCLRSMGGTIMKATKTKTCVRCHGFAIFDELVDIVNSGNEWGACYRCVNCGHCEFLMPAEPVSG
jgi:hypothetical protein